MKLRVERVSQTGLGIASGGKWYNRGKNCNLQTFLGLEGAEVEIELTDDKWVTKLTKLAESSAPSATGSPKSSSTSHGKSPHEREEIARGTAIKAVLGSPLLAQAYANVDGSEAVSIAKDLIEEVAGYVLTGEFKKLVQQQEKE